MWGFEFFFYFKAKTWLGQPCERDRDNCDSNDCSDGDDVNDIGDDDGDGSGLDWPRGVARALYGKARMLSLSFSFGSWLPVTMSGYVGLQFGSFVVRTVGMMWLAGVVRLSKENFLFFLFGFSSRGEGASLLSSFMGWKEVFFFFPCLKCFWFFFYWTFSFLLTLWTLCNDVALSDGLHSLCLLYCSYKIDLHVSNFFPFLKYTLVPSFDAQNLSLINRNSFALHDIHPVELHHRLQHPHIAH